MPSSRMHIDRSLTVSRGIRLGGSAPPPPDADLVPHRWTGESTHACENITLPQTSFEGGKYT